MLTWILEKLNPKYVPNKKEQLILKIIENLCNQPDTDIRMAPISGRYYIINKRLKYWVRIYDDGISITNHTFTFSNHAVQMFQAMVVKIVQNTIEVHRTQFESTVFQNEVELLENIINNIENKKYE
jgi:hypothetical protein